MVPDVFVGSAITDVSVLVFNAVRDLHEGRWEGGTHHKIGLEDPSAVRLKLADSVPDAAKTRVEEYAEGIRTGRIAIPTSYDGPEFEVNLAKVRSSWQRQSPILV